MSFVSCLENKIMKYLGIDYGKKNIGLAISDSAGKVAMVFGVFKNDNNFLNELLKIIEKEKVEAVVFGLSLDLDGRENFINQDVKNFVKILQTKNKKIKIFFQDERFSSMESKWGTEKQIRRPQKKDRRPVSNKKIDDKAAVMILRDFLNKK